MKHAILLIIILAVLFLPTPSYAEDKGPETVAVEATEKGWRYFGIGDKATALKRFRQATILDPGYAPAYYGVAYIYSLQDRLSLAIQYYRKAIELADTPDTHAYGNLGLTLIKLGKRAEGLQMVQKALAIDPDNSEAHIGLASFYCAEKNGKLAREHLERGKSLGAQPGPELIGLLKTTCP